MANSRIFSVVLRISDAALARAALEAALGVTVERYERTRTGSSHYAQIDLPIDGKVWSTIAAHLQALGPRIAALRQKRQIGTACVDVAISFAADQMTLSVTVPSFVAEAAGLYGIDIELSVYLTRVSDGE